MNQETIGRIAVFSAALPAAMSEAEEDILKLINLGLDDFDLKESPDAIKTLVMLADIMNALLAVMINKTHPTKADDAYFRLMATIAMAMSRFARLIPNQ